MDVKHSMDARQDLPAELPRDTHSEDAVCNQERASDSKRARSDVLSAAGLSADFLELAHDLVGVGSYVLNLRTRIIYISREMALLLGLEDAPLQMLLDVYRRRFYAPDWYAEASEIADEAYTNDRPLWLITQIIRADGRAIWVRTTSVFRVNDAGDPVRVGMLRDITEQHDASESIEKHAQQLRAQAEALKRMASIMEHANDVILMMDEHGHLLEVNHRAVESYGYTYDELKGMVISDLRDPSTWQTIPASLKAAGTEEGAVFETLHRRKDGTVFPVEVNSRLVEIDGQRCRLSVIRDITQRKEHEAQMARFNRLYAAVGQINLAVVAAPSREALFKAVCKVLVDVSLFKMAWVGWKHPDTQYIEAVASCGDEGEFLKTIRVYADKRPEGLGPTGIAVREARTYVCNDFLADPCTLPWRAAAGRHGFRASISLPFCQGGQVVGALTAYATACNVFGEKEITLCNEAAAAITLALDKFEHEQQRAQAEARQRVSDERLRAAFHSTLIAYAIMERDGRRMVDVNLRMADLFGYTREEMIGRTSVELGLYDNLEERQRLNHELDKAGYVENYEGVARRKNGERFYVALSAMGLHATNPPLVLATLIDITTRKEAERELEQHRQNLEKIVADRTERLVAANQQLQEEIAKRKKIEDELRKSHAILEERVQERTRELTQANQHLSAEVAERKHAEVLLRTSEEQYRCIVETAQEGIYMYDADWRFIFVNKQLTDLLGYTREEMVGHPTAAFVFERDQEAHADRKAKHMAGMAQVYENAYRKKNGDSIWFRVSSSPIFREGVFCGAIGLVMDITERKQAAEALQASENRFRTLIEQAPVAIAVVRDARIIYANHAYRELFRIPASVDLIGCSILDQWAPESRNMVQTFVLLRARGENVPIEYEGLALRFDGDTFPIRVAVTTVYLNDGAATVGFLMDQTAIRSAENALRQAEELYRGIFDGAAEGIFRSTPEGRVLTVNPTMARILAYESPAQMLEELTDTKTLLWPSLADRERFIGELDAHNEVRNYVCQLRRRDGSFVWTLTNARRVAAPDGRSICYEGFISDITEKKQLEEQFLRVQRLESIGMLAAGIAHDLNNVLTPINMAVQLLREMHQEPTETQILKTLEVSAERGVGLVRQILGFARGVSGEPQLVQVRYLLQDVADMITKTFPKSIELRVSVGKELSQVMANPTQLHQVVLNLCLNARDAMPHGGSLLLGAENRTLDAAAAAAIAGARPGAWLVLRVEDTGTGMSPDVLARIWEPFFTTKALGQGTGLGLPTVRGIVESHGGFIVVTTALGQGTTFEVFIPPAAESIENTVKEPAVALPQGGGETILFVDDEEAIRSIVQRILVRAGYRVVLAENGAQALKTFNENPAAFALIITDAEMPVMDGRTLSMHIRAHAPNTKILMVSGLESQATEDMWSSFADDFLQKPFVASGLVAMVKKLLISH